MKMVKSVQNPEQQCQGLAAGLDAQGWGNRVGKRGTRPPPQILTDQLPLSEPGRADYANHITSRPQIFRSAAIPDAVGMSLSCM